MADINEILGRQINSVKELKSAISELQNSLIGVDTESEQYKTTSQQLAAAQAELTKVTRAGKEENNAAADSIRGMEKEYKALYDQYKMLTDEQRNSDIGKNMAASLETLSNKLNKTKKEVGNFKDNIGRYAESAGEAFNGMGLSIGGLQTPLKLAKRGVNTFGKALKTLAKNPIGLFITAIVAILTKAAEAIKKNEQLSNRLNEALAALKPVTDALANVFDFLAGMIVKAVEGMSKAVEWISKINPKWNAAVKSHKELAKATNDLTKAQREAAEVNAKKQSEVEDLRARAAAATDATEKLQLLEEAKAKQAEIDQTNLELAQEDLRIKEALAEKTANDTQAEEELAAARKKVGDLTAQASKHEKEYNEQIKTTTQAVNNQTNATNKTTVATTNYRDEAKKLHDQLIEDNKDEITKLTEKYEKEKKLLEKYGYDTKLLTQKYNKAIADYNKALIEQTEKDWQDAYQRELDNKKRHTDNVDKLEENELVKRITNLTKLQYSLSALSVTWNSLIEGTAKDAPTISAILKDLKENGDWTTIPEGLEKIPEVLRPIRESLMEISTDYGVVIKNNQDLADNIKVVDKQLVDALNDYTMALEEKMGKEVARETVNRTIDYYKTLISGLNDATTSKEYVEQFKANIGEASEYMTEALKREYSVLEYQKGEYEQLLQNDKLTFDQRTQLLQGYSDVLTQIYEKQEALRNLSQQRTAEMVESLIDMTDKMAGALNTYRSSQEAVIDSEVKRGLIDEKEARKRKGRLLDLQAAETAFSIATIAADAASGIFSIWKGYATERGVINPQTAAAAGPGAAAVLAGLNTKSLITAIAKTASLASTAAAQIAAAKGGYIAAKNNYEAEGAEASSAGVAATPVLLDSQPYSYARTIQTQEEEAELNRPVWVSVQDIESSLGHQVVVRNESSF